MLGVLRQSTSPLPDAHFRDAGEELRLTIL
jgi:hypothetical protein